MARLSLLGLVMVAVLAACGVNGSNPNVRRGLLRSTSIPKSAPDAGRFRPAGPKSEDGSPVRPTLR
jgi:hypothetical protein